MLVHSSCSQNEDFRASISYPGHEALKKAKYYIQFILSSATEHSLSLEIDS